MSAVAAVTADDIFIIGLALDDWLSEHQPSYDEDDVLERYEATATIRKWLGTIHPLLDHPQRPGLAAHSS